MIFPFSFWKQNPLSYPGLVQWYDAAYIDPITGVNAIDRSGSGRPGINTSVSIVANVISGLPVFRFNGTTSKFTYTAIGSGTNFSAFAFVKNTSSVTAKTMFLWSGGVSNLQVLGGNASNQVGCFDGSNNPVSGVVDDYTNFSLMGVVCTSGTCVFYKNGVSIGTGASNVGSMSLVGNGFVTAVFSTMDVTEMVFYTTSLGTGQISGLTQYFRGKSQF